jgi:hypothetical protein
MKKILLLTLLTGLGLLANAQSTSYRPFKFDIDFGYAQPASNSGLNGGFAFCLEPQFRLSNELAIGFRIEGAAMPLPDDGSGTTTVYAQGSYALTANYYLSNGTFRPFVGVGVGYYLDEVVNSDDDTYSNSLSDGKFGFFPRIGFEVGHFRLSGTYNIIGDNQNYDSFNYRNYATFNIGFFFGGGRK